MNFLEKNHKHTRVIKNAASKTLKMLVLAVAITFGTVLSASTNPTEDTNPVSLTKTVGELLRNPEFRLSHDVSALVCVLINDKDEIVVLSVETNNKAVENYIKNRLNYKKIPDGMVSPLKTLKIPVKISRSR